jgi:hypothetical protein
MYPNCTFGFNFFGFADPANSNENGFFSCPFFGKLGQNISGLLYSPNATAGFNDDDSGILSLAQLVFSWWCELFFHEGDYATCRNFDNGGVILAAQEEAITLCSIYVILNAILLINKKT